MLSLPCCPTIQNDAARFRYHRGSRTMCSLPCSSESRSKRSSTVSANVDSDGRSRWRPPGGLREGRKQANARTESQCVLDGDQSYRPANDAFHPYLRSTLSTGLHGYLFDTSEMMLSRQVGHTMATQDWFLAVGDPVGDRQGADGPQSRINGIQQCTRVALNGRGWGSAHSNEGRLRGCEAGF